MQQGFNSFSDINRALASLSDATKRHTHSLDHMFELLDVLGNPHKKFKVLHVAGTSGKTSTAYYAAALLKETGKTVGLTVSPHVDAVNERVQINLEPMPEAEFCKRFGEFFEIVQSCRVMPNYFEMFVSFAFWEFAARRVDYAVVEVGIGGLLDSTNVFDDPEKICLITDIGYDHMNILGDTLEEIAGWKAGIIQLHNAVFCNQQGDEVMGVIRRQAQQKQADLHVLNHDVIGSGFDFLPGFQKRNLGLSLEAVKFLTNRDQLPPLDDQAILRAAHAYVPARMEVVDYEGKTLILDGAHNAQKIGVLAKGIQDQYSGRPTAALVGLAGGRNYRIDGAAKEMVKLADHLIVTQFEESSVGHDGSVAGEDLVAALSRAGAESVELEPNPQAAFRKLLTRPEDVLVVAGSFYLLNHVRPLVKTKRP